MQHTCLEVKYGYLQNPAPGRLYVRGSGYGKILKGPLNGGPFYTVQVSFNRGRSIDFEQVCFLTGPATDHGDYGFVNAAGQPVPTKEELIFVYQGEYFLENGSSLETVVQFWLRDGGITFSCNNGEIQLPFTKVYLLTKYRDDTAYFLSLDQIHPALFTLGQLENGQELIELEKKIAEVNTKFSTQYKALVSSTQEQILAYNEMPVLSVVRIQCTDGSFLFYPTLLPIAFSLKQSLFNHLQWKRDVITLDCTSEQGKSLFGLFLGRQLPSSIALAQSSHIELYATLSDYLGLSFWAEYFATVKECKDRILFS